MREGELMSVQGRDGCTDPRCTQIDGRCVGYHCSRCGGPTGMYGHFSMGRHDGGTYRRFADGKGRFSCQPGYAEAELGEAPE